MHELSESLCGHLNEVKNKGNDQLAFPKGGFNSFTIVVVRGLLFGGAGRELKMMVTRTFQTVLS